MREEYRRDIQLLIGFEAEYCRPLMEAQDELLKDYPLDYMILGQHFVGQENNGYYAGSPTEDEKLLSGYVDLCIEAMKSGRYRYLAHPDLIHFTGKRERYEAEMRRLCMALKEMGKPVEMNVLGLAGGRNYPNPRFWEIARDVGNQVVIGIDAHDPKALLDKKSLKRAERLCRGMESV